MTEDIKLQTDELPEGISAALDKLMANPQIISMVASALGGASPPKVQAESAPATAEPTEQQEEAAPVSAAPSLPSLDKLMPLIGKLAGSSSKSTSFKHEQLLCAIKPYLSPSRCQAIDQIIRISKMSAIIGQLKP